MMSMRVAPPKNVMSSQGRWSKKPGAIPMFGRRPSVDNSAPLAESKSVKEGVADVKLTEIDKDAMASAPVMAVSMQKPAPPARQPSGIPVDKNAPPVTAPVKEAKPPAPVRPAPNRNRAPPVVEPEEEEVLKKLKRAAPLPPSSEAPFTKASKTEVIEQTQVTGPPKALQLEHDESSDDEEERKTKDAVQAAPSKDLWSLQDPTSAVATEVKADKPAKFTLLEEDEPPDAAAVMDQAEEASALKLSSPALDKVVPVQESFLALPVAAKPATMPTSTAGLKSGRLSVRLVEGSGLMHKTNKAPIDPFIKLRVGASDKFEFKRSATIRKAPETVSFNNEIIAFDLINPNDYSIQGDIQLVGEVWSSGVFDDKLFGTFNLSIVKVLAGNCLLTLPNAMHSLFSFISAFSSLQRRDNYRFP